MAVIRHFIYLDEGLVSQFSEQITGGITNQTTYKVTATNDTSMNAGIKANVLAVGGGKAKGQSEEQSYVLQITGPAAFNTLYEYSIQNGLLPDDPIERVSEDEWSKIRSGELLEFVVNVRQLLPEGINSEIASQAMTVVSIFESFEGIDDAAGVDLPNMQEIQRLKKQAGLIKSFTESIEKSPIPCEATLLESPKYRLFFKLPREWVKEPSRVEGELKVLCKVDKVIQKGSVYLVNDLLTNFSPPKPNRAQRRQGQPPKQGSGYELRYPALVVTPVALYR